MQYPTADEYRALIDFEKLESRLKAYDQHFTANNYYKDDQWDTICQCIDKIKTTQDSSSFCFHLGGLTGALMLKDKLEFNAKKIEKADELVKAIHETFNDVLILIYKNK